MSTIVNEEIEKRRATRPPFKHILLIGEQAESCPRGHEKLLRRIHRMQFSKTSTREIAILCQAIDAHHFAGAKTFGTLSIKILKYYLGYHSQEVTSPTLTLSRRYRLSHLPSKLTRRSAHVRVSLFALSTKTLVAGHHCEFYVGYSEANPCAPRNLHGRKPAHLAQIGIFRARRHAISIPVALPRPAG